MIDNHIYWGNDSDIDMRRVVWRRVMDMNDRALRHNIVSMGGIAADFRGNQASTSPSLQKSWQFCACLLI